MTLPVFSFRMLPQPSKELRVDRATRTIFGVSVIEMGEAKGHDLLVDETTVQQTVDAINASALGIKSRFTHPGMCNDGMGSMLGRVHTGRVTNGQAVADLTFAAAASTGPRGDLAGHVMDLAEEDPTSCGLSIVFKGRPVWKLKAGGELPFNPDGVRPADATTDKPFARIASMSNVDVVDEPAATSGLLAAAFSSTSNADAAQAFAQLDQLRDSMGLSIAAVHQFAQRYCAARGFTTLTRTSESSMDLAAAQAFAAKHPAHAGLILERAGSMDEAQLSALILGTQTEALSKRVSDLGGELAALKTTHAKELADAKTAHDTALTAAQKTIVDLQTRLGIKADTPPDVGNLPAGGAVGESAWRAEFAASAVLQENFYAGADSYVAFKHDEAKKAAK